MTFESPLTASKLPAGEKATHLTGLRRPVRHVYKRGLTYIAQFRLTGQRMKNPSCVEVEDVDTTVLMPRGYQFPVGRLSS